MSSAALVTLPQGYQYAGAAILSTFWLHFWQMVKVSKARSLAKIPYPQLYAEKAEAEANKDAYKFNCTQRAHQNTLENLPTILGSTAIVATQWPIFAASACGLWVAARVLYTIGYSTGDPAKRNMFKGTLIGGLSMISLLVGATAAVGKTILY
ncbi:unnamed protein product [Somion occarium]|uniref:Membrane-associated proteins in eicosanoid and glutathione metabolism n=1 Tax=Somion occarium TaxID=3059160 RepID=A0ABP1CHJ4_9APHY